MKEVRALDTAEEGGLGLCIGSCFRFFRRINDFKVPIACSADDDVNDETTSSGGATVLCGSVLDSGDAGDGASADEFLHAHMSLSSVTSSSDCGRGSNG
mmetsp:Transcript_54670/g.107979  ORF Transcript_54670/g.107979 Transcript_54670/m.107979 type:complete len:99 (-) Transcript_54670:505-801(-)